jgi:hypothetical protein
MHVLMAVDVIWRVLPSRFKCVELAVNLIFNALLRTKTKRRARHNFCQAAPITCQSSKATRPIQMHTDVETLAHITQSHSIFCPTGREAHHTGGAQTTQYRQGHDALRHRRVQRVVICTQHHLFDGARGHAASLQ